jgi:hypothetical protein
VFLSEINAIKGILRDGVTMTVTDKAAVLNTICRELCSIFLSLTTMLASSFDR